MTVWLLVGLEWATIAGMVFFAERAVQRRRRSVTTRARPVATGPETPENS